MSTAHEARQTHIVAGHIASLEDNTGLGVALANLERDLRKKVFLLHGCELNSDWDLLPRRDLPRAGQHLEFRRQGISACQLPLDGQQAGVVDDKHLALGLTQEQPFKHNPLTQQLQHQMHVSPLLTYHRFLRCNGSTSTVEMLMYRALHLTRLG